MSKKRKIVSPEDIVPISRYIPRSFYCENCALLISSYENDDGIQRVACPRCGAEYKRTVMRHRIGSNIYPVNGWTFVKD